MASLAKKPDQNRVKAVARWIVVMAATLAFFYGLDHVIMSVQGLPLDWNMTPAN